MNFVDLIPIDKREFVKEVLDNTVLTEEEKDTVIRPIVSQDGWNEYQQWKQMVGERREWDEDLFQRILKDRLPFLSETENEAQQSVILEVVHDKSLSEEKREELLRNLLSPVDFQTFLEWKPSNIAVSLLFFLTHFHFHKDYVALERNPSLFQGLQSKEIAKNSFFFSH